MWDLIVSVPDHCLSFCFTNVHRTPVYLYSKTLKTHSFHCEYFLRKLILKKFDHSYMFVCVFAISFAKA